MAEQENSSGLFAGVVTSSDDFRALGLDDVVALLASHGIFMEEDSDMTLPELIEIAIEHFMLYHKHVFREDELLGVDFQDIAERHGFLGLLLTACDACL